MRVNFNIKSNIKRAIETGELLYLDYKNKNEKNTFYYFGIKSMNFDKDKQTNILKIFIEFLIFRK